MKQDLRSHALVKAAALLLAVACGTAAALGWIYGVFCAFPSDGSGSHPVAWNRAIDAKHYELMDVLGVYDAMRRGEPDYLDEIYYQKSLEALSPERTNFRYIIRDAATGELLLSSSGPDSLRNVPAPLRHGQTFCPAVSEEYSYRSYDPQRNTTTFFDANGHPIAEEAGDAVDLYREEEIFRYAVECGVDETLPVMDRFRELADAFHGGDTRVAYYAAALTLAFLALTVFLMSCAGRRRGADAFVLNWSDRIPYDLYLPLAATAAVCGFVLACDLVDSFFYVTLHLDVTLTVLGAAVLLAASFALTEAALMSTATRVKAHALWSNTLTVRLCKLIFRGLRRWWQAIFGNLSVTGRVIALFLLYLLGTVVTTLTVVLIPFYQGVVLFGLCKWAGGWRKIREGTAAIVGGHPDAAIDTSDMDRSICSGLKAHAEQLNDLGSAINSAVEERLKSERMKAELITNVSHDLKTPLTSIINYVDLLKQEDIQNETARGYIEVLDRKAQRLKKLTEDLVEASKASTGAIAINRERLGVVQLVNQALGEYNEKFAAAGLTVVPTLLEGEAYVLADGRHLWRVLDNLMGNCVKYAMAGTRVYLELRRWDGNVIFSLKNVSASQLNIPAEQLMERFVRGDESRTTEGSGLGLSIARSLTGLQGGAFRLEVDGDLFKATVSLPEIK